MSGGSKQSTSTLLLIEQHTADCALRPCTCDNSAIETDTGVVLFDMLTGLEQQPAARLRQQPHHRHACRAPTQSRPQVHLCGAGVLPALVAAAERRDQGAAEGAGQQRSVGVHQRRLVHARRGDDSLHRHGGSSQMQPQHTLAPLARTVSRHEVRYV